MAIFLIIVLFPFSLSIDVPKFKKPASNLTIAIGREAVLSCAVENLNPYKVAWLKVDTQTILTIHNHVITKNNRIGVSHSEFNIWNLHIREVKISDQGWYMCQINTDPMKSQLGYLNVVVPPDILDYPTSADMILDEGSGVSLQCIADGSPEPSITWKREGGEIIRLQNGSEVYGVDGSVLNMSNIKRDQMGPYLCIASNGIPPSVSKRIKLVIQFPPSIWIQYQLIGAYDGQQVTLECYSQAYPKSINYWTRDSGEIIPYSSKYIPENEENGYKVYMKLKINFLEPSDYGIYKCISKNSLGEMEGSINVYKIPDPNKILLTNKRHKIPDPNKILLTNKRHRIDSRYNFEIGHGFDKENHTKIYSVGNYTTQRRATTQNGQPGLQSYYSCAQHSEGFIVFETVIYLHIFVTLYFI